MIFVEKSFMRFFSLCLSLRTQRKWIKKFQKISTKPEIRILWVNRTQWLANMFWVISKMCSVWQQQL
jgi:hypothetical protein